MRLHIANKNYSSWSLRPWIAMKAKRIAFEEALTPFDDSAGNPEFRKFSPTGKVPVLVDGNVRVWESLAILEYLHDKYPDRGFWPADMAARAHARAIATEMHAGFSALRSACHMNIRRDVRAIPVNDEVRRNVARIEAIWDECLKRHGGPFLFGEFCNADAMYAPVVNRLEKYILSSHPAVLAYTKAIKSHDAWREWEAAAVAEPWIVPADEA